MRRSLKDWSRSLDLIAGSKSDLFPVHAGPQRVQPEPGEDPDREPPGFIFEDVVVGSFSPGASASSGGVQASGGLVHERAKGRAVSLEINTFLFSISLYLTPQNEPWKPCPLTAPHLTDGGVSEHSQAHRCF